MKLIKLKLRNFKGIRSFDLEAGGQSVIIYGQNASGKTSVADAVTWLLFDKDTQDRSPAMFGIKTLDENGNPLHGEQHTVEAEFSLDGKTITLRKVYEEKWTKRRGYSESELTGHTTSYYWDEEPVSQKEYKERIEAIMPEQLFKMLTIPSYFAEKMHWKERRDALTDLCGFIDDQDIIDANPDLKDYPSILDGKSQESTVKILRERKKEYADLIDNIPSRIDENRQKITQPEKSEQEAKANIQILKENIASKQEKLSEVRSGGGVAELNVEIQKIESEKAKALNEYHKSIRENLAGARKKVSEIESKLDESQSELRAAIREHESAKDDVEKAEEAMMQIVADIQSASEMKPDPKPEGNPKTCPYCEQEMPHNEDQKEDHYEKYVSDFNLKKSEKIKELKADLQQAEIALDDLHNILIEKEIAGIRSHAKNAQREQALEKAKADLEALKAEQPEFVSDEFDERIEALQKRVNEIKTSKQSEIVRIQSEISELENHVESQQRVIREHENNRLFSDRIQELTEELKQAGKTLNDIERSLNVIEEFNRAKAGYITGRVNDMFSLVKWRLFKDQRNGGVTETADPMVNGVPYSEGLNNAARIQAGMDIIKTLSKFYGKSAPVFVDNRESVTELPESDLQVISLIVSPEDRVLRIESAKKIMEIVK